MSRHQAMTIVFHVLLGSLQQILEMTKRRTAHLVQGTPIRLLREPFFRKLVLHVTQSLLQMLEVISRRTVFATRDTLQIVLMIADFAPKIIGVRAAI